MKWQRLIWTLIVVLMISVSGGVVTPVLADGDDPYRYQYEDNPDWPLQYRDWTEAATLQEYRDEFWGDTHKNYEGWAPAIYRNAHTNSLGLGQEYDYNNNSRVYSEKYDPVVRKQVIIDEGGHCYRPYWFLDRKDCKIRLWVDDEDVSNRPQPWGWTDEP